MGTHFISDELVIALVAWMETTRRVVLRSSTLRGVPRQVDVAALVQTNASAPGAAKRWNNCCGLFLVVGVWFVS